MALEISKNMIGQTARFFGPMKKNNINLVMIICNHCPYVLSKMSAISQLVKDYKNLVNIVAVNSNDSNKYPKDAPELMPKFKDTYDLQCEYIYDKDQTIAQDYGAVCTPEFYIINESNTIIYHGELDPTHRNKNLQPNGSSLRHALDLTLTNNPISWIPNPSFGCSIKWR